MHENSAVNSARINGREPARTLFTVFFSAREIKAGGIFGEKSNLSKLVKDIVIRYHYHRFANPRRRERKPRRATDAGF